MKDASSAADSQRHPIRRQNAEFSVSLSRNHRKQAVSATSSPKNPRNKASK
jgi:hypothetical protein